MTGNLVASLQHQSDEHAKARYELVCDMAFRARRLAGLSKKQLIDITHGLHDAFGETEEVSKMCKPEIIEVILLEEFGGSKPPS